MSPTGRNNSSVLDINSLMCTCKRAVVDEVTHSGNIISSRTGRGLLGISDCLREQDELICISSCCVGESDSSAWATCASWSSWMCGSIVLHIVECAVCCLCASCCLIFGDECRAASSVPVISSPSLAEAEHCAFLPGLRGNSLSEEARCWWA